MSYSAGGKELLVDQLRAVFVARGYDGATLANLARAVGLSKASLYHHFPGGKPEMVSALVRHSIADLQKSAFSQLHDAKPAEVRLSDFIDGFLSYTDKGHRDCLLAVLNHHDTASEETAEHQIAIAAQFADWHESLASVFVETGANPKKAQQEAYDLMATMYGALLMAKMHNEPKLFTKTVKRYRKRLLSRITNL